MAKIISFYSFRDGTGKTTITANVAAAIAQKYNQTVAGVDTNFAAHGLHHFFIQDLNFYLNNYLNKDGSILKAIYDVGANFGLKIKLIPASGKIGDMITTIGKKELDYKHLCQGLKAITKQENEDQLDYVLIDCFPGIQEANLLTMSISDMVFIVLRENQQDWQETTNTLEIITKLGLKKPPELIINQAISRNTEELKNMIQRKYQTIIREILPQAEEIMEFSTPSTPRDSSQSKLFYRERQDHIWSKKIGAIADTIVSMK